MSVVGMAVAACGCANLSAPEAGSRLEWLADNLAAELAAAEPYDPRVLAAQARLAEIAAYAAAAPVMAAQAPPVAPSSEPTRLVPDAATFGAGFSAEMLYPSPDPAFAVLAAAVSLPAAFEAVEPPPPAQAIALGGFSDEALAAAFWNESNSLDLAALTGLSPFVAPGEAGVSLLAGADLTAEEAQERCAALEPWGLNCEVRAFPDNARAVGAQS
jgi:hypothetical protein